ncbi:hypothetical protein I3842_06G008300 [Carya illinoinensis]|uniref:Ion transport domain-containing protein n=1 Tax=Carya illinoinensis TaxID=32201 RepID=A0A922ENF2_CARIL|nr:hypothetical protein I3842_06G008300 [Carya illinoinensis]KAG6706949.1 hypothetical protein I3842_06G008300 [Carya illinoinensis]
MHSFKYQFGNHCYLCAFLDLIAIGDLIAKINNYPDMKCSDYVINILSILPFPQVIVPIIFSEMRDYEARFERRFLNAVVLLQYVPRIFRIYRLWKIVNETIILPKSSVNGESNKNMKGLIVMKAGFNLFLYLVAGHVLGAFCTSSPSNERPRAGSWLVVGMIPIVARLLLDVMVALITIF